MKFEGTYTYLMDTPSGKRETKVVIRKGSRAYEGELFASHGGCELLENVCVHGDTISFEAQVGPARQHLEITLGDQPSGTVLIHQNSGENITTQLEGLSYAPHKRRALILYATMTKNTERIALSMKDGFEACGWECNCYRLKKSNKWADIQDNLYFEDYDVVCLGSPIVAG